MSDQLEVAEKYRTLLETHLVAVDKRVDTHWVGGGRSSGAWALIHPPGEDDECETLRVLQLLGFTPELSMSSGTYALQLEISENAVRLRTVRIE